VQGKQTTGKKEVLPNHRDMTYKTGTKEVERWKGRVLLWRGRLRRGREWRREEKKDGGRYKRGWYCSYEESLRRGFQIPNVDKNLQREKGKGERTQN